mmetsp:Transcript_15154/g.33302  ORF Transcript_15154/g.33302 Transcript_15154/m.33302 type:complete len:934 (+) Transcript_15154:117-2918(+)
MSYLAYCMGPFCGRFRDELEGDEADDDEEEPTDGKTMFRGPDKKKKRKVSTKKSRKKEDQSSGLATVRWAPWINTIHVPLKGRTDVTQQVVQLKVVNEVNLKPSMVNSISQLAKVHTLEIIRCARDKHPPGLNELELLTVFRMSHNHLQKFPEDLAKCSKLERIILDWNHITDCAQGIFGPKAFGNLEVINLAHNRLSFLPPDFCVTQRVHDTNRVKYLDLSFNSIAVLPDSITLYCKQLEVLNLAHNKLKKLPANFELLELQRLFVSFNELVELPENIGKCSKLSKIRIVSNQIRELPPSMLDLWKLRKGKLDEFLVERNPLVMPSITAFEMGDGEEALNFAFKLFEQHLQEQMRKETEAKRQENERNIAREAEQLALANVALEEKITPKGNAPAIAPVEEDGDQEARAAHEYYFAHCNGMPEAIAEIRNAESTLLLIKNSTYFNDHPHLDSTKDLVPCTDLDLYFMLMVISTKPMYTTCHLLFDKFEVGAKGHMAREEWNELCMCVPISMTGDKGDRLRDAMWILMAWRQPDRILLQDFVAAWHIHDIETRDPWITRIADVLHLDYYDMTVQELRDRLRAQDSQDATPQLDFNKTMVDAVADDDFEQQNAAPDRLANFEGIRQIRNSPLLQENVKKDAGKDKTEIVAPKHQLVSLTSLQRSEYEHQLGTEEGGFSEASDASLSSRELSEETAADDSEFDAQVFLNQRRDALTQAQMEEAGAPIVVDSDEALKRLMEISPKEFFRKSQDAVQAAHRAPVVQQGKIRRKAANRKEVLDSRLKTDVFAVRQAIREVYRSMPYNDFVQLINFLLRGLQSIKHSTKNHFTYWHCDDPTFRYTMGLTGANHYTRSLLTQMGFVLLGRQYWVWPSVHLPPDPVLRGAPTWGDEDVPGHCAGKHRNRLDDMICLLRSCQRMLHKRGRQSFTGHFKTLTM